MDNNDFRSDPSISTEELLERMRKHREKEQERLREELQRINADIKVKCDYLIGNPEMCTLEAVQVIMDIINSKEYTFASCVR